MTTSKDGPGAAPPDLESIRIKDSGGTRSGNDRRQISGEYDSCERRSGRDRRRGFDRRADINRRRTNDRRHSGNFWDGEIIERRESFRKNTGSEEPQPAGSEAAVPGQERIGVGSGLKSHS